MKLKVLLLERFYETLPENIQLWLIDKNTTTLQEAARLADMYVVNHKINARPSCVKLAFAVETPDKTKYYKNSTGQHK